MSFDKIDTFLSSLFLESTPKLSFPQFSENIDSVLFQSSEHKQLFLKSIAQCKEYERLICGSRIKIGDLSFQCFDCAIDLDCHLLCEACFKQGNHKGHKIRYSSNQVGTCDCGDLQAIEKSECVVHKINTIVDNKVALEYISQKLLAEVQYLLTSFFGNIFKICENLEKNVNINQNSVNLRKWVYYIFKFILEMVRNDNIAMIVLMAETFHRKNLLIKSVLKHDCNNTMMFSSREMNGTCSCSILENIFRFNFHIISENSDKEFNVFCYMEEVFTILFRYYGFKREFALTYNKMFNFIVFIPKYPKISTIKISKLFSFYTFFFTKDVSEIWIKSYHFLNKLIEKTGDIIDCFFTHITIQAYNAFDLIKNLFFFILKRETISISLSELNTIEGFLEVIRKTHCQLITVEEDNEKCRMHIECTLLMIFKDFVGVIIKLKDNKQKDDILDNILNKILDYLNEIYSKKDASTSNKKLKNMWPLHNTLQRSLSLILSTLLTTDRRYFNDFEGFKKYFLSKFEEKKIDLSVFYKKTLECILKSLKFSQEKVKPATYFEFFDNPYEGIKREVINCFYKKSYYMQYDYDITLLQILIAVSPPKQILSMLSENFELDFQQIYFKTTEEGYKVALKNFLELMTIISIDEISFLNATSFASEQILDEAKFYFHNSLSFLLINTFHLPCVSDLKSIKCVLFDKVLNYDVNIDELIKETTNFIPNSKILKLNPELSNYYDPYLFYKYPKLSNNCYEGIKKLAERNNSNDLILGNHFPSTFKNNAFHLNFLMKTNLFTSDIIRYLMLILKIDAFSKQPSEIIKHTLKLISISLHALLSLPENGQCNLNKEEFLSNIKKYFITSEFRQRLAALKNFGHLSEFKQSLTKLEEDIETIAEKMDTSKIIEEKHKSNNKENSDSKPKISSMLKKQEKIKKDFLAKQKLFAAKHQNYFDSVQENIKDDRRCFFCHDNLVFTSEIKPYGIYVYIIKDNLTNYLRKKENLKDVFLPDPSPSYCLTSCLHYVHKECNEKTLMNNLKALTEKKILYNTVLESLCGNCKSLSNLFLFIVEEKIESTSFSMIQKNCMNLEFDLGQILEMVENIDLGLSIEKKIIPSNRDNFWKVNGEFFDNLLRYFILEEENEASDEWILLEMFKILSYSGNEIIFNGLSYYFNKQKIIYRNMYLLFREYFWKFESKNKVLFLKTFKQQIKDSIDYLYNFNSIPDKFDLAKFDLRCHDLLWKLAILFKNEDFTLYLVVTRICQRIFKIFHLYYAFNLSKEEVLSFQDLQQFQIKNDDFLYLLSNYVSPISRKLLGFLATIFKFEEKELKDFYSENFDNDQDEIKFFNEKIGENIFTFDLNGCPSNIAYYSKFCDQIAIQLNKNNMKKEILLKYYEMSYHVVLIQNNYLEFQKNFIFKTCYLCNDFSRNGQPFLCLVCGNVLCSISCTNKKNKKSGNLNSHFKENHCGVGIAINLITTMIFVFQYPKSLTFNHLFKDNYGQSVNVKDREWEKYLLDQKMFTRLQEMIIRKGIPQQLCYRLMDNELCLVDPEYL